MMLKELFEMQRKLDEHIIEEKGLEEQDLFSNKILALQVELGELANEWQGFKHWKKDPTPKKGMLEEYVDCLHFILSIGLEIKDRKKDMEIEEISIKLDDICKIEKNKIEITKQFNEVFYWITIIEVGYLKYFVELVREFLTLGYLLDFTWEQVVQAYKDKNKINHRRQENGY